MDKLNRVVSLMSILEFVKVYVKDVSHSDPKISIL